VRQLELTESLRKTELRLEQVDYLPQVSLFGTYAISSQQNGDPDFFGAPRAYSRNVGVQLTLPIFQGFQRDARVDQKRAVLRQAETQTALARSQATAELRSLVEQADEAWARAEGQRLAVTQATRGFDIARAQYREGLGSQLELTDAEVALRQSEFNYAQAVYDFLVARARLDAAAGRVPLVDERLGETGDA
jgi:outer membrane protein TolC